MFNYEDIVRCFDYCIYRLLGCRFGCRIKYKQSCNDPTKVHSAPLSIWTGADCWEYVRKYDVPYCEIYDVPGIERTGCVFCGFGAHLSPARFYILRNRYPKLFDMCMNYTNNGCTFKYALYRMGVNL